MIDYKAKVIIADTVLIGMQDVYYQIAPFPLEPRLLAIAEYYRPLLLQERRHFFRAQEMYDGRLKAEDGDFRTLKTMVERGNKKLEGLIKRAEKAIAEVNSAP
jgi:hypothetical protein